MGCTQEVLEVFVRDIIILTWKIPDSKTVSVMSSALDKSRSRTESRNSLEEACPLFSSTK